MQINSRYFIHPSKARGVLDSLYQQIVNKLPSREVSTNVVLENFYTLNHDHISVEQVFDFKQLQGESLKGKPQHIRYKRETTNTTTYQEFGFTSAIDLRKALEFLNYQLIGTLTQVRTGFILRDPLIELPVVINETKEFGCFLEIGDAVGAIEDIHKLLQQLYFASRVTDEDMVTEPYGVLLARVRGVSL